MAFFELNRVRAHGDGGGIAHPTGLPPVPANVVPCFTPGTRIATPKGERLAEDIKAGDRILTRDNGIQEVVWVSRRDMAAEEFKANPTVRPVLIPAGSLGNDLPERDMLISPNHRMLVVSKLAEQHFGTSEILVAAKHLIKLPGISQVNVRATSYIHFMFEKHEVVLADGAWSESFQPSDASLKGVLAEQRAELFGLFPDLASAKGRTKFGTARRTLKKLESYLLFK